MTFRTVFGELLSLSANKQHLHHGSNSVSKTIYFRNSLAIDSLKNEQVEFYTNKVDLFHEREMKYWSNGYEIGQIAIETIENQNKNVYA